MFELMNKQSVRPIVAQLLNPGMLHKWVARIFSCYLTYKWFLFTTQSDVVHIRFTFRIMIEQIPKVFVLFVIGLWLSTTDWGWRHKKTVYLLLLPSLLMSPQIVGFPFSIMGWLSFLVALWSYFSVYKAERTNRVLVATQPNV
jgi:hypothetical protein